MNRISDSEKDFIILHIIFTAACILLLALPIPTGIGIKLLILVIFYHSAILLTAKLRGHDEWKRIWLFTFFLSIFQVMPDWVLSDLLRILVFPEDGLFKIGTVSGYMAGLWTIPMFIIIFIGSAMEERFALKRVYFIVAVASLIMFGISEQTVWLLPSWYPVNLNVMISHTAVYILIPEILLGLSGFYGYRQVSKGGILSNAGAAFLVSVFYTGAAVTFYFIIEKILFNLF